MNPKKNESGHPEPLDARWLARLAAEGYGPGAWHGPDLKAAVAEVSPALAFARPAEGRHSIAEIALHHAYCTRGLRARFTGVEPAPFVLEGDDWFALESSAPLAWQKVLAVLEEEQERLRTFLQELGAGRASSPLAADERLDLALGIACHAVYHAGQIQLVKRLLAG